MKFEIGENKLEKVVFKYLYDKKFIIRETPLEYIFLTFDEKYIPIKIRKNNMICLIYFKLVKEISSFFSISEIDSKNFISRYVKNKFNLKISGSYIDG